MWRLQVGGAEIAAIIVAVTGLLALFGGGIKYLITLVLDAYKQQITQTTEAKNAEIAALHERINRHMEDINFLRETVRKFPDVGGKV